MDTHGGISDLRDEVTRVLAAALATDTRHLAELDRRDALHVSELDRRDALHQAEIDRRDSVHQGEMSRRADLHEHELDLLRTALETRDLIGQAKGVLMVSLSVSADEAFELMRKQSQHENVKLVDVAAEIARRAASRRQRVSRPQG